MVSFGSRRGEAGALSVYLMAGAFLAAAGLMAWLFVQAAPVEVEVVEGGPVTEVHEATVVAVDVFGADPMAQADMLITLHGLPVLSLVGTQGIFSRGSQSKRPIPYKDASRGACGGRERCDRVGDWNGACHVG